MRVTSLKPTAIYMSSYNNLGWGTHDNISYGHPIMQNQGSSSSYYQEQFRKPSDEELFLVFREEIKKDNEALQMRLSIMELKMDANMIADMGTISKNLNREMYAIMERTARQTKELEEVINQRSSRQLPSDIKNDEKRGSESISLCLEDEFLNWTLDENQEIMECDKMPLVLEGELQTSKLVEKNELAIDKESLLGEKQVEKQHLKLIMKNVLVGVEDLYFPI